MEDRQGTGVKVPHVVAEWKVHRSAVASLKLGKGVRYQYKRFNELLSKVAAVSKTRLRVGESAVQVRGREAGKDSFFSWHDVLRSIARLVFGPGAPACVGAPVYVHLK